MTRNDSVIAAFARGQSARAGNLSTDGQSLWSYNMRIAHRTADGDIAVGDYTAGAHGFVSQTTSCHVGLARRVADTIMLPEVYTRLVGPELPF